MGASARLRPWLPLPSALRSDTMVTSPGSLTTVPAGSTLPLSSASAEASTTPLTAFVLSATSHGRPSGKGRATLAGHTMAATRAAPGRRRPASSCMPLDKVSAFGKTVPAAYSTLPSALRTAPPSTLPAGKFSSAVKVARAASKVPLRNSMAFIGTAKLTLVPDLKYVSSASVTRPACGTTTSPPHGSRPFTSCQPLSSIVTGRTLVSKPSVMLPKTLSLPPARSTSAPASPEPYTPLRRASGLTPS